MRYVTAQEAVSIRLTLSRILCENPAFVYTPAKRTLVDTFWDLFDALFLHSSQIPPEIFKVADKVGEQFLILNLGNRIHFDQKRAAVCSRVGDDTARAMLALQQPLDSCFVVSKARKK